MQIYDIILSVRDILIGGLEMNRGEFEAFVTANYLADPEYLWKRYPSYAVFRHSKGKKWFAVVMNIPKSKLGIDSNESVDVVNLKCNEELSPFIAYNNKGIFPAYHMNKRMWVSVLLDGSVTDETIEFLLDISFNETLKKGKSRSETYNEKL